MNSLFRNSSAGSGKQTASLDLTPKSLFRAFVASTLCILMVGCATPNLDASYQPKSTDAIIVLGVAGAVKVGITPGRSDGKNWRFVSGFKNRPLVSVRDGFVVVRLDATFQGQRYGVYQVDLGGFNLEGRRVTALPGSGLIVPASYAVPVGKAIATFPAESGTVTYIGTVAFEMTNTPAAAVIIKDRWEPDGAARHMSEFYPALVQNLRCVPALEFQKNKFTVF
jgi:hypothetical protein